MDSSLPQTIHFQITSKCNNNCKHCFGPNRKNPDMEIKTIKKMLRVVIKGGAKNIHLTGGEPTVRKDFDQILKLLNENGLKIFLDTNSDFFFDHVNFINKYISVLGVSIDFPEKSWRNSKNLKNVLKALDYYKNKTKRPKLRILTTVTKENIDEIDAIGELLKDHKFDVWRIFQFLPVEDTVSGSNKNELEITNEEFSDKIKSIKNKFSKFFTINAVPLGQRNRAYFMISSHGEIMIPTQNKNACENFVVGNVFDSDVVKKWQKYGSKRNFQISSKEIFDLIN